MFTYKYLLVLVAFITISSHVQAAVIPQGTVEARDATRRFSSVDSNALTSREPGLASDETTLFTRKHSAEDTVKGLAACAKMAAKMKKGEFPTSKELSEAKKLLPIKEIVDEIRKHDKDLTNAQISQLQEALANDPN